MAKPPRNRHVGRNASTGGSVPVDGGPATGDGPATETAHRGPLVTRRRAVVGTAAAAGTAIVMGTLAGCSSSTGNQAATTASAPVVVSSSEGTSIIDFESKDTVPLSEGLTVNLPLGTVPFASEGTWLPYLAPGVTAMPLNVAGAISLVNGSTSTVVSAPLSSGANYVIFDVRCSDSVYAWVEVDIVTRDWTLVAQGFSAGALTGSPVTLWTGDSDWDPPLFCCSGKRVLWQVMPSTSGSKTTQHSGLYLWHVGDTQATEVYDSPGRFATEPAVSGDTVTIVPRVNASSGVYYGITAYQLSDDCKTMVDQLVLPVSVKPFHAVRVGDDFAFSVEANYSSGGLLSAMGSYIGHGSGPFVYLPREPSAGITGHGGTYVIKSKASYFVADTANKTYGILTARDRAVDYGEYPASVGDSRTFVTFSTVKGADTGYPTSVVLRTFEF